MVATAKADAACAKAVELAQAALTEHTGSDEFGDYLGFVAEGERVGSHYFACALRGYEGWRWSVTVARASRQKPTVGEVVLMPGDEAIVAPQWLPYKDRIRSGDLSPGDVLPVDDGDSRLVPTYSFGDDDLDADDRAQIKTVARELFLGRIRTLSPEGREQAAQRWYDGESGPDNPMSKQAPGACTSCGFLIRLAGSLAEQFGVCANGNANDDGRVVAFGHGCGAHSEAQLTRKQLPDPLPEHVFDTLTDDELEIF